LIAVIVDALVAAVPYNSIVRYYERCTSFYYRYIVLENSSDEQDEYEEENEQEEYEDADEQEEYEEADEQEEYEEENQQREAYEDFNFFC
jgi:hypothetical protein